jgi:hypothetical protein
VEEEMALRPGELVEVRWGSEILATLDEYGDSHGIPFMPEMLVHLGRRFRVAQQALKVCGPALNVHLPPGVVCLEQLRCDGAAHGGCQVECRIFWREEWLPTVSAAEPPAPSDGSGEVLARFSGARARGAPTDAAGAETWHCQASQITHCGTPVSWKEPTQYLREVTSGNVGARHVARVMARAVVRAVGRKLRLIQELPMRIVGKNRVNGERLGRQPGDWVEVRSAEEIGRTLDDLKFTDEMVQHCGKRLRFHRRIERIVDEVSGRMLLFKNDCVALEGLACSGDRATNIWFCRRDLYPCWREAWLKCVDGPR